MPILSKFKNLLLSRKQFRNIGSVIADGLGFNRYGYRLFFMKDGSSFVTRAGNKSDRGAIFEIYCLGEYDAFKVKESDVVVDIGANIGAYSVYAGRKCRNLFSYEPHPDNFRMLQANIHLNALQGKAKPFMMAVGGETGKRSLYLKGPMIHSLRKDFLGSSNDQIEVVCTSLADILKENGLDHVDLLKIDSEGAEYETIMKAPLSVLQKIDRIIMEYHNLDGQPLEDITKRLSQAGFTVDSKGHGTSATSIVWGQKK